MTDLAQQDIVYALAAAGADLYAARLSGLYRSQDGGQTWRNALTSLAQPEPLAITAVATAGAAVFAGTKGAVLRSDDAGANWQIVGLASPAPNVTALVLSPNFQADGVVVAGTADDGVFVSTDRGLTWIPWNFGLVDLHVYALAISPNFAADRAIFAGTESGVFRSHNGGRAWRATAFPMASAPVLSLGLATDGRLYAGTETSGLFLSDDLSVSWRPATNDFASAAINAIQLAADQIYLLLEDRLVFSPDGGDTWKQLAGQIPAGKTAMTMLLHPTLPDSVIVGLADGEILQMS